MKCVLSIGGSDCSAGAGVQADLKTFTAFGVYGLTAITCVVAEIPGKVSAIQGISPRLVAEQIRLLFECFPIAAVKTGLLHSSAVVNEVCGALTSVFAPMSRRPFLVVDPVMVATSGHALLDAGALEIYRDRLFPMADLITPNLDEAEVILGRPVTTVEEMRIAVNELASKCGAAVLLKGGHLQGAVASDILGSGGSTREFSSGFVAGVKTHGTGCAYSAAIAAGIAKGLLLEEAIGEAKRFVTRCIQEHLLWDHGGHSIHALNHAAESASTSIPEA